MSRFGVTLNGLSNLNIDKMKKTCLPKEIVTFIDYAEKIYNRDGEIDVARRIFQEVRTFKTQTKYKGKEKILLY